MAKKKAKTYTCFRWPQLVIGSHATIRIVFQDGRYSTDDPEEQAFIEGNESFGAQIRLAEKAPERGKLEAEEGEGEPTGEAPPQGPNKATLGGVGAGGLRV